MEKVENVIKKLEDNDLPINEWTSQEGMEAVLRASVHAFDFNEDLFE